MNVDLTSSNSRRMFFQSFQQRSELSVFRITVLTYCRPTNSGISFKETRDINEVTGVIASEIDSPSIRDTKAELISFKITTGVKWSELAVLLEVKRRTIHYWLNGSRTISPKRLLRLYRLKALADSVNMPPFLLQDFFVTELVNKPQRLKQFHSKNNTILFEFTEQLKQSRFLANKNPAFEKFASRVDDRPVELLESTVSSTKHPQASNVRRPKSARLRV